jgi:hypothetical protein
VLLSPADFEARFWSRVRTDGPVADLRPDLGRCWPWTGPPTSNGYGQVRRDGKPIRAHVVAWELACGEQAPPGLRFEHFACSGPASRLCCNPAHVRPVCARRAHGHRFIGTWNERHSHCLAGHELVPRNKVLIAGIVVCRTCLNDGESEARRLRRQT